jgi:hypothetical protein
MKSSAERQKARYIRSKGPSATPDQRAWLRSYEASAGARKSFQRPAPSSVESPPAPVQRVEAVATTETGTRVEAGLGEGYVPVSFDQIVSEGAAAIEKVEVKGGAPSGDGPRCGNKDCPHCAPSTAIVCGVTGKTIYPPMGKETSEAYAGMGLSIVGLMIRYWRDDRRLIKPTDQEKKSMGTAIREIQRRRFNVLGAADDLMLFVIVLSGYFRRASTEEAPKEGAA